MSALDRKVLTTLEGDLGDRDVVREIVSTYLGLLPERQRAVDEALRTDDLVRLRREAHKLGSASATVGAVDLRDLCRAWESGRAPAGVSELRCAVAVWASCCVETKEALAAWLTRS